MPPEDIDTETGICKATSKFMTDYRTGVTARCALAEDEHETTHRAYAHSMGVESQYPEFNDLVFIEYYWPGEFQQ